MLKHRLHAFWRKQKLRIYVFTALLVAWEAVNLVVPAKFKVFAPGPTEVFQGIVEGFQDENLAGALWGAFVPMMMGYGLSIVIGVPLGILMGINRSAERIVDPYINGFYVAPISAILPAMIFWFGSGFQMRMVVAFLFSFFVVVVNAMQGAKQTPADFIELARSFCAGRFFIFRKIVIPNAVPYIMVGFRLGLGRAMVGIVIAELLVTVTGLGEIINNFSSGFRLDGVLGVALVIMLAGVVLTGIVQWLEGVIAPWKLKDAAFKD